MLVYGSTLDRTYGYLSMMGLNLIHIHKSSPPPPPPPENQLVSRDNPRYL